MYLFINKSPIGIRHVFLFCIESYYYFILKLYIMYALHILYISFLLGFSNVQLNNYVQNNN